MPYKNNSVHTYTRWTIPLEQRIAVSATNAETNGTFDLTLNLAKKSNQTATAFWRSHRGYWLWNILDCFVHSYC